MCQRYPKCKHRGVIMDKRTGLIRHCDSVYPNHECPYIALGCLGCMYKNTVSNPKLVTVEMLMELHAH